MSPKADKTPKIGVVIFPGSNCDQDALYAVRLAGGEPVPVWHQSEDILDLDGVILPGGFSYGDYLRAGAIARFSPVVTALTHFAAMGGVVLGICNGFQILLEAGLLPGAMLRNKGQKFICDQVILRVDNITTPFTWLLNEDTKLKLPIAHHDGNYYAAPDLLAQLEERKQIVFRYSNFDGEAGDEQNPNGSTANIAGICNERGNVLGMMPHPERAVEPILGSVDGMAVLKSMVMSSVNQGMVFSGI